MQELEESLGCKHTAMDAVLALNRIYGTMQERAPQGGRFLRRWARVLLRPNIRHVEAACEALEQALLGDPETAIPGEDHIQGAISCCSYQVPDDCSGRQACTPGLPSCIQAAQSWRAAQYKEERHDVCSTMELTR